MQYQALCPLKDKSKKIKSHLLQFLFGTLRANIYTNMQDLHNILSSGKVRFFSQCKLKQ